jgi:cytidylate kinase
VVQRQEDHGLMVVTIDGPAGVGKSTVARRAAERVGFQYINSGSFYRAVTLAVLRGGGDPGDPAAVVTTAGACLLELKDGRLHLDGACVEDALHSDQVDRWVAAHSSLPAVRDIVNQKLRGLAAGRDVVVEGRDIGTVVFPDAALKIFLDADVATRAARRHDQGVSGMSRAEIERTIRERDTVDRNKPTGRLAAAPDARSIDTSHLTIDQVCDTVAGAILVSRNNPGDIRGL